MKNIILVSLVTLLSFPTLAETCGQHLDKGIPSSNSDQFLCRDGYAVGYNYNTKNADWVAYHITAESVNITNKRSNASGLRTLYLSGLQRLRIRQRAPCAVSDNGFHPRVNEAKLFDEQHVASTAGV